MTTALDRQLVALRREVSSERPPPAVERAVAAAIARAERAAVAPARRRWPHGRDYRLAGALAIAASVVIAVVNLRAPSAPPQAERTAIYPSATEFIPVVPLADIAGARGAYVVSTPMPRTMLADFGLPVSPVRAAEPVQSELLVRGDGTVLAVRFLE